MIDWAGDYQKKFESNPMIAHLKESKFHGKLVINFCEGSPNTSHIEWFVRPYSDATIASVSTLKGGDDGRT